MVRRKGERKALALFFTISAPPHWPDPLHDNSTVPQQNGLLKALFLRDLSAARLANAPGGQPLTGPSGICHPSRQTRMPKEVRATRKW